MALFVSMVPTTRRVLYSGDVYATSQEQQAAKWHSQWGELLGDGGGGDDGGRIGGGSSSSSSSSSSSKRTVYCVIPPSSISTFSISSGIR